MLITDRAPYGVADLQRLLEPRSIAILGVSERMDSFGQHTLRNLDGYEGKIYLVNPKHRQLADRPCYASVSELPEVPDCVVVASGRAQAGGLVREAAEVGVGGALVYAAGYSETGLADRKDEQDEIVRHAGAHGMRLLGPNCIGFVNFTTHMGLSFTRIEHFAPVRPHAIGLVSQSGAIGLGQMLASRRGVSFSHVLNAGNSADVDVADLVNYLAEHPACAAVACIFEGMRDPRRLVQAIRHAANRGKPVVVFKLGTSSEGQAAALSHTGSLAGSLEAYRAVIEGAGGVLVENIEHLLETTCFLAKAGQPTALGVAVVASSGGASVGAADKAELHGVPLPQPPAAIKALIAARIPEYGSSNNPFDVTAQIKNDPHLVRDCASVLLAHPSYGAMIYPQAFYSAAAAKRVADLGPVSESAGKIICVPWLCSWSEPPGIVEVEEQPGLALFRSMDSCFAALAAWHRRAARVPESSERVVSCEVAQRVRALLTTGESVLTESAAKEALRAYGVPVVQERLVNSREAAVQAAQEIGYPVALKVESADILHKTDAGVVRLALRDAEAVAHAFDEIQANALKVTSRESIKGTLVQPMVPQGVEILVGAQRDPSFGPLLAVGLGGVFVELLKDTAVHPVPVNPEQARRMLDSLRGRAVLDGFRGAPPVAIDRLVDAILRLSEFAADHADVIESFDVNPLTASANGVVAVDALIILKPRDS